MDTRTGPMGPLRGGGAGPPWGVRAGGPVSPLVRGGRGAGKGKLVLLRGIWRPIVCAGEA